MKLLTAELRRQLPAIGSTSKQADPLAICKWFTPWAGWTWYVCEFNPEDGECFGLVDGLEKEAGYFSLAELEALRGPGGLRIERDLYWEPCRLSELQRSGANG
jgi:hypothetical protein